MNSREEFHKTIYLISALLVVVSMPFSTVICSWSLGLFVLNWMVEGNFKTKILKAKSNTYIKISLLLTLIHIISLIYTDNLNYGIVVLEKKTAFFLLPLVMGTMPVFSKLSINKIFSGFIIACSLAVIYSFTVSFFHYDSSGVALVNLNHFNADKFFALFPEVSNRWHQLSYINLGNSLKIHPMYFSMYLLVALGLLFYNYRHHIKYASVFKKTVFIFVVLSLTLSVLMLSSRVTIICLLFLGVYFIWSSLIKKYLKVIYSVFFIVIFSILLFYNPVTRFRVIEEPIYTKMEYPNNEQNWNSINLRLLEWNSSTRIIGDNLLLGVGIGDAADELNKEYDTTSELGVFDINLNSHNQYLQTALNLGAFGLIIFIIFMILSVKAALNANNPVYLIFLSIILLCCFTESILEAQKGIAFFSFFNSLFFFHDNQYTAKING